VSSTISSVLYSFHYRGILSPWLAIPRNFFGWGQGENGVCTEGFALAIQKLTKHPAIF
jgi:hypothetical protein